MNFDLEALDDHFSQFHQDLAVLDRKLQQEAQDDADLIADIKSGLPPIENSDDLAAEDLPIPPEIIKGFLHQGLKGVLGSSSKAKKTWVMFHLAIAVSTGTKFWNYETIQGKVLYINFEIPRAFTRKRLNTVKSALGIPNTPNLHFWNLRGKSTDLWQHLHTLIRTIKRGNYILVIIDPIYKGLAGREENAAEDVALICNELESVAVQTGAAVLYAAHFSKGNQASKEAIDRISGSGVWGRDADSMMIMTKHATPDCYTIETILRNLKEEPPFVVQWQYPLMTIKDQLDPADLKKPGRPKSHNDDQVLQLLENQLTTTEWQKLALSELGVSKTRFFVIKKDLQDSGRILLSAINRKWSKVIQRPNIP